MEEITPREFDSDRINPDADSESIATLTFLLELPHCLRIDDLVFLVSDRGGSWPGWSSDAIGHMAGISAPVPEEDLRPRFRVEVKQIRVDGWFHCSPPNRLSRIGGKQSDRSVQLG